MISIEVVGNLSKIFFNIKLFLDKIEMPGIPELLLEKDLQVVDCMIKVVEGGLETPF